MRPALAKAVHLIAIQGKMVQDAAEIVGMNASALSRAINRPEIAAYMEEQKALYSLSADSLKGMAKALAIHTGMDLMRYSASDTVKARMVEFFAAEARQPGVVVQVNAGHSGYQYERPIDAPSADHASQPTVIEGKASPVDE